MKITVIVAKIDDSDMPWILGAWDEYTIWEPEMAMRVEQCIFCGGDEGMDARATCGGCRKD